MLSTSSESKLMGVHRDLVRVVRTADRLLPTINQNVEFIVGEGVRTIERQRQLFAAKATRTMDSRHLTGHAVDLWAMVDGDVRWDWGLYYVLGEAMRQAAIREDVPLVWGGVWDLRIDALTPGGTQDDVEAYVTRRRNAGQQAFIDGPHYELDRKRYP